MGQTEADADCGLARIDHRVVVIARVVGEAERLVVGCERRLERILGLVAVLVDLDGPIVDLGDGDYFNVIAEAGVLPLSLQIAAKVLCYVLFEVVSVFGLFN